MQLAEVMQAGGVPENRLSVPGENSVNRAGKLPSLDSATAIDKAEKLRRSRVNMERMYQELFDDWHSSAFQDEQD